MFGEIMDGSFQTIRRNAKAMLGASLLAQGSHGANESRKPKGPLCSTNRFDPGRFQFGANFAQTKLVRRKGPD